MSETAPHVTLLHQQMATQQKQHQEQLETLKDQNQKLLAALTNSTQSGGNTAVTILSFTPFDSSNELWSDYWAQFITFTGIPSIQDAKQASQLTPSKDINQLSIAEIMEYMQTQFAPTLYIVQKCYKLWSDLKRKPGETIPELAARIRQDAVK